MEEKDREISAVRLIYEEERRELTRLEKYFSKLLAEREAALAEERKKAEERARQQAQQATLSKAATMLQKMWRGKCARRDMEKKKSGKGGRPPPATCRPPPAAWQCAIFRIVTARVPPVLLTVPLLRPSLAASPLRSPPSPPLRSGAIRREREEEEVGPRRLHGDARRRARGVQVAHVAQVAADDPEELDDQRMGQPRSARPKGARRGSCVGVRAATTDATCCAGRGRSAYRVGILAIARAGRRCGGQACGQRLGLRPASCSRAARVLGTLLDHWTLHFRVSCGV